jgi:uncharacterized protein (DUF885 family)
MRKGSWGILLAWTLCTATLAAEPDWIRQSNEHAQVLLEVMARYNPEAAASLGVEGHDEDIFDLKPRRVERQAADFEAAAQKLEQARTGVSDPRVAQDLQILIDYARDRRNTLLLEQRLMLFYFDLPEAIFRSFQNLIDPRVPKDRQKAALVRLHRYVGAERGYEPITSQFQARFAESAADSSRTGPWVSEVQTHLEKQSRYVDGIEKLLKESGLKGWQRDFATLKKQLADHAKWVRAEVLPRARPTNRLPREIYADNLKAFGVTMQPEELIDRALGAYTQARDELAALARVLAEQRGWKSSDYRDVIRELKKQRITKDQLLDVYRARTRAIEETVRREAIVSLPTREVEIRLATEAEAAASLAPHIDPPRLVGNTGERAQFVLAAELEDFSYDAIAWTLSAHEARPGHDLQFASMLEQGVSTARIIFAFNSANVEGWALYAEAVMKKHLPLEGQIGSLQMRMMRAARAFLDPMLNLGLIEPDQARKLLMDEVMLSEAMARSEVDRYTFDMPGQATAYFFGYSKLAALRARAELALGDRFREQAFHDFILSQGLLPLDMLEQAVMESFVPSVRQADGS